MFRLAFTLWVLLLLAACQTRIEPPADDGWQRDTLSASPEEIPETWELTAKAGLVIDSKSEQANLAWQRRPEIAQPRNNKIRLFGPFGAGTVVLEYGERNVLLTDNKGKEYWGDDAEELLNEIVGWPLPLKAMRYWMFAQPSPDAVYEYHRNEEGQLTGLRQFGWEIQYSDWRDYGDRRLPRKIFAHRLDPIGEHKKLSVKLFVKSWRWP